MLMHRYLSPKLLLYTPELSLKLVSGVKHVLFFVFLNQMISENTGAEVNLSVYRGGVLQ